MFFKSEVWISVVCKKYFNMDEEYFDENLLLLLLLLLKVRKLRKSKCKKSIRRRPPKFWVRNIFKKREELDEYHHLIQEMSINDREYFFRYA